MNNETHPWFSVDALVQANRRGVFCGARMQAQPFDSDEECLPFSVEDLRARWHELVEAAHHDLDRCAALLGMRRRLSTGAAAFARELERTCNRWATLSPGRESEPLLARSCVLAGATGRLIRDAYAYANTRIVMASPLIDYQLVAAKLADMAIANEIIEQRLLLALSVPRHTPADVGLRGVPAPSDRENVTAICRGSGKVLKLYVEIHAGHAFVQPVDEAPVLAIVQFLLDGLLASLSRGGRDR